jgi:hypothetical protein
MGDKLDLHDVLTGFDPLTSTLSDFVHITTVGRSSIVSVDADGTGSASSFVQIATLQSVTHHDENDLLAQGLLIV